LNEEYKRISMEYIQAQKDAEKATKKAEELAKKLEKAQSKKENKKEYVKDLAKALEKELQIIFKKSFTNEQLQKSYINLRLYAEREKIINNIAINEREFDYLQNNYERILQKVYKIFKNDIDAKQELKNINTQKIQSLKYIQELKQQEENRKKKERETLIHNFIYLSPYIAFLILIFMIIIVLFQALH